MNVKTNHRDSSLLQFNFIAILNQIQGAGVNEMRNASRLAAIRKLPCVKCGQDAPSQACHSNDNNYVPVGSFFIRIAVKPRGLARGYKAAIR